MSAFLFAVMSTIWGAAFIATKFGVMSVPPVFYSATRFVTAGMLIFLMLKLTGASVTIARRDWWRIALVALFVVIVTPSFIFWGTARLPSGLAAVINLAVIPVGLLAVGMAVGAEPPRPLSIFALIFGLCGLAVLFWPRIAGRVAGSFDELAGALAVAVGSLGFAVGSIIARPLTLRYPSFVLSAHTGLWGGLTATILALAFEPGARDAADGAWGWPAWLGWAYILLPGTICAHTIYIRLMRDWGAARAGMYAFISPLIALGLGAAIFDERLSANDIGAAIAMLAAAVIAIRAPAARRPASAE